MEEASKAASTNCKKKKNSFLDTLQTILLVVGFAIMLGSIFFANEFRPVVAGAVNVVVGPVAAMLPFYMVVLVIAAIVTLISTFIQKYTMDWELMQRMSIRSRAYQKEYKEAQLSGNKHKLKKLQEEQLSMMEDQTQLSKQQLKPMGFLMIISVPLFFWMFWFLTNNPDMTMVFPFWGEQKMLDGVGFIFQYWIVWSIICSLAISQVIRKAINVGVGV
ncbi:DUF106 domain-containing protein [Methanocella sp. MCL-LM]|uniref:DUF106 domain-containing protein n=1 Tax=Methanocella sp. MCL-LM TaxID=3412035 RepID=UPI003C7718BC